MMIILKNVFLLIYILGSRNFYLNLIMHIRPTDNDLHITIIMFTLFNLIFAMILLVDWYSFLLIFLCKIVWRECLSLSLSLSLSLFLFSFLKERKRNDLSSLISNSNKRIFFAFADTICKIDRKYWENFFCVGEESEKDLKLSLTNATRHPRRDCFREWTKWLLNKSVVFFFFYENGRCATQNGYGSLEFSERNDANKTPTHRRLPRKHARRGIVNIWTSKRGKRRLIGGFFVRSLFSSIQFFV